MECVTADYQTIFNIIKKDYLSITRVSLGPHDENRDLKDLQPSRLEKFFEKWKHFFRLYAKTDKYSVCIERDLLDLNKIRIYADTRIALERLLSK
jgi:hypothetical protein